MMIVVQESGTAVVTTMRSVLCLALLALLSGCATPPPKPTDHADTAAVMGMLLMASSAQEKGSAASALWQIRIPPAALDVITSVHGQRRSLGRWPKREEVKLPEGVSEIILAEGDRDLDIAVKGPTSVLLRCVLSPDGTTTVSPSMDRLIGALQGAPGM